MLERSPYDSGNRTWHDGIEPSKERLNAFKHRNLRAIHTIGLHSQESKKIPEKTFPKFYVDNNFALDNLDG